MNMVKFEQYHAALREALELSMAASTQRGETNGQALVSFVIDNLTVSLLTFDKLGTEIEFIKTQLPIGSPNGAEYRPN